MSDVPAPVRAREVPLPTGIAGDVASAIETMPSRAPRPLPVVREAITLPMLLLTVAALGGVRVAADHRLALLPPSVMSLVLAAGLIGVLVRSGTLAPFRLVSDRRSALENGSGVAVIGALVAASAQVFSLLTPAAGLPAFVFTAFFVLLLWNTLAVEPGRRQVLRSLLVVFGGAFVLKFVVLTAIYEPEGGLMRRVMLTLLDGIALGTLGFVPDGAATGYIAFLTLLLYFAALIMLPSRLRRN